MTRDANKVLKDQGPRTDPVASVTPFETAMNIRSIKQVYALDKSNPDRQGYIDALHAELGSMIKMGVFRKIDTSILNIPESNIGRSMLLFVKKYKADGSFDKYKCRMVFRGDRWIDHYKNKTYAGTVLTDSVHMMFALMAAEDMEYIKADAKTAFLHADVPAGQHIYMYRPPGLTDAEMDHIVELKKTLYGLPMAPAQFRLHSENVLKCIGFVPLISDPRIYKRLYGDKYAYVTVHVDDFGIFTPSKTIQQDILQSLSQTYDLVVSDDEYLGITVTRDRAQRKVTLTQTTDVIDLAEKHNISIHDKHPITPMTDVCRPDASDTNKLLASKEIQKYQSVVGALLYLATHTRPDILYATNMASRHTKAPTMFDSEAALRILKYLVGTRELGLCFQSKEGIVLYGTVDASYGMHADRKSHTGITLHIGEDSGSFLTRSKKQTVLADSSTVAEYIAAHSAAKEVQWARSLLEELGYKQLEPTVLYEDNKSTIHMINNESHTQKTKHVDIRYQYIREAVKNQVLTMVHKDTENMTSDIETKPAPPRTFLHLRPQLLGMNSTINMYPQCMEELIDSLSRGDHFCDD
jgi:hypothetical protein